jgi:predicted alpha/beta hydrolase
MSAISSGYNQGHICSWDESTHVSIQTKSGSTLSAEVLEPKGRARGTIILAHAIMVSRSFMMSSKGRNLAEFFVAAGFRALAFDFRGHGNSTRDDVCYDTMVTDDIPSVVSSVNERFEGPVFVVGHSLGGHVACASVATGSTHVDGIILVAANIWMPHQESSWTQRLKKDVMLRSMLQIARPVGYMPTRKLGLGSENEPLSMIESLWQFWHHDRWENKQHTTDYGTAMKSLNCPLLSLSSCGDTLLCSPECAVRFMTMAGSKDLESFVIGSSARANLFPSHMGIIREPAAQPAWDYAREWLLAHSD